MVRRRMEEEMICEWVERPVVLDGGAFSEADAQASFRVRDDDLHLDGFTVDGCIFRPDVIAAQIGKTRLKAIIEEVEGWWDDEGLEAWRYANG